MFKDIRYYFNSRLFIEHSLRFYKSLRLKDNNLSLVHGKEAMRIGNKALKLESKIKEPIEKSIEEPLSILENLYLKISTQSQ